ncbi:MAG TPA: dipeptide epimerase [Puia sp.]|nr:dipeptide epimerase [Puia sp.]
MKVRYWQHNLKFRHPFTISKGSKTHQPTLIVELEHLGLKGYGEAPAITYYNITVEKMIEDIEHKKRMIEKFAFTTPERYWHYLHHLLPQNPFLVCALDMAAWDLFGKINRKPIYELWGLDINKGPMTDYTIGIDSIEKMVAKIQEKPWPLYKIKLGTDKDVEILQALRKHTDAMFRVDANAAWEAEAVLKMMPVLQEAGVELIEQPLAKDDWDGMKLLSGQSALPLIADESCVFESDIEKCAGYFHGINIKLTKCSGITPALRMIEQAKKLNLKIMIGCMNESTVGSAAIANMLPLIDFVDMDGPLLLEEDVARGIEYDFGIIKLSGNPGLGIEYFG